MNKKNLIKIIEKVLYYTIGYIWYFSIYLVLIPYIIYLLGRNLDALVLNYLLGLSSVFYFGFISIIIASIIALLGLSLIAWSFYVLYFYAKCFPFAACPFIHFNPKKLATYGPYSLIRHPMTLGYLFLLIAFGVYMGSIMLVVWIIPIVGIIFYEYIKHREERRLALWFGKEFEQYKQKTPMLIPNFFKSKKD